MDLNASLKQEETDHIDALCEEWDWTWASWSGLEGETGPVPFLKPGAALRNPEIEAEADLIFEPFHILRPAPLLVEGGYPYPVLTPLRLGSRGARWWGDDDHERREAFYTSLVASVRGASGAAQSDHIGRLGTQHETLTRMIEHYGVSIWGGHDLESYGLGTSAGMLKAWYEHARDSRGAEFRDPDGLYWSTRRLWSNLKGGVPPDDGLQDTCAEVLCDLGADTVLGEAVMRGILHLQAQVSATAKQAARIDWKREAIGAVLHALALDRVPPPFAEVEEARALATRTQDDKARASKSLTSAEQIAVGRDFWAVSDSLMGDVPSGAATAVAEAVGEAWERRIGARRVLQLRTDHGADDMSEEERKERVAKVRPALPTNWRRLLKP